MRVVRLANYVAPASGGLRTSGTPVVVSSRSALPEVVGPAGPAAEDSDAACADAVEQILGRDVAERRRRARQQAERFDWPSAVNGFLAAHDLSAPGAPATMPVPIMQPVGQR